MLRSALTTLLLAAALPAAAENLHYNIVEFSESAGIEVPRDTMTAHFSITAEGKERNAVSAAFRTKFDKFNKAAQNSRFKTELLSRSATPRYQYTNGKRTQTGWEESAEFKVESKDFDALNRLIAATQDSANLDNTGFSVSKEKRETAIDQVSQAAILRFKDRAQDLAKTLGFSSYKIVKLNLGHIGSRNIDGGFAQAKMLRAASVAMSASADYESSPQPASPGAEEISITVNGSVQM